MPEEPAVPPPSPPAAPWPQALIFDVDGTLAETEELHRRAFLAAFAEDGLDWDWSIDLYRELLRVTGGKERIRAFLDRAAIPASDVPPERIARLHARKTEIYGALMRTGACTLRPGVEATLRRAHAAGLPLAICTTTSRPNVDALLAVTLGETGVSMFAAIVTGEDVAAKKPAPDAYHLTLERLGLPAAACLAFEDSANGLAAARAAHIPTLVTPSLFTAHERFDGAARVIPDLSAFDLADPLG